MCDEMPRPTIFGIPKFFENHVFRHTKQRQTDTACVCVRLCRIPWGLMGSKKGGEAFVFGVCCSFATKLRNAYYASSCFNAAAMAYKKHINHMQQSLTLDSFKRDSYYTKVLIQPSHGMRHICAHAFFHICPIEVSAQNVQLPAALCTLMLGILIACSPRFA